MSCVTSLNLLLGLKQYNKKNNMKFLISRSHNNISYVTTSGKLPDASNGNFDRANSKFLISVICNAFLCQGNADHIVIL